MNFATNKVFDKVYGINMQFSSFPILTHCQTHSKGCAFPLKVKYTKLQYSIQCNLFFIQQNLNNKRAPHIPNHVLPSKSIWHANNTYLYFPGNCMPFSSFLRACLRHKYKNEGQATAICSWSSLKHQQLDLEPKRVCKQKGKETISVIKHEST